jgi:ketosteroid isomerase-like protein
MQSDRFRAAAEKKDFSALEDLFTEDVSFRSPVVFKQYEGRDSVAMLLAAVSQVSRTSDTPTRSRPGTPRP